MISENTSGKNSYKTHCVLFGIIGGIIGGGLAGILSGFLDYLSGVLEKPLLGELSMVFFPFAAPVLGIIGIILGVRYARKYKN